MVLNEYGVNSKFKSQEVENPTLKGGEVLIKISASSINTVDTMIRGLQVEAAAGQRRRRRRRRRRRQRERQRVRGRRRE